MRTLAAWIEDRRIGSFIEDPQADGGILYAFEYDSVTTEDIVSLTMVPAEGELRFATRSFPAPFDMILPEGERRAKIEASRKILRTDSFSLLSYVGWNPVNRVRFLPPDEVPGNEPPELPTPAEIASYTKGKEMFRARLAELDLRQGISGVQPKLLGAPAQRDKLSPALRQFRGSTHILKASTDRFPFLAVNERTCLEVFQAAGLATPHTTLSADGELLLVERFDIRGQRHCVGFEEAAALMGETSATKYQRDYGSMIESLVQFVAPHQEDSIRRPLTKALLLNHLLGNGDAHLKNFGVLYEDAARVTLAPFYDCVSTLPYIPEDVPALALSFEWYSKAWWPRRKIEDFAIDYGGLSPAETARMIEECSSAVDQGIDTVTRFGREIPGFGALAQRIAQLWRERVTAFAMEETGLKRRRTRR
jgi:serine/threonine-protein kinase HipA